MVDGVLAFAVNEAMMDYKIKHLREEQGVEKIENLKQVIDLLWDDAPVLLEAMEQDEYPMPVRSLVEAVNEVFLERVEKLGI